jgi:NTE family protein
LSNGNELLRFFRAITKDKKFKDAAFDVRITGSDYSRGRLAVFNRVDDPEMPLATAMRITSAMPGAFSAVEYDGAWYKDGGVYAHVPVEASRAIDKTVVVALAHDHSNGSGREEWSANMGLVKEVERTVDLLVDANVHAQMEKAPADTVKVFLSSLGYGSFDFDLALDEKDELYRHGYDRTKKMLLMAGL